MVDKKKRKRRRKTPICF